MQGHNNTLKIYWLLFIIVSLFLTGCVPILPFLCPLPLLCLSKFVPFCQTSICFWLVCVSYLLETKRQCQAVSSAGLLLATLLTSSSSMRWAEHFYQGGGWWTEEECWLGMERCITASSVITSSYISTLHLQSCNPKHQQNYSILERGKTAIMKHTEFPEWYLSECNDAVTSWQYGTGMKIRSAV